MEHTRWTRAQLPSGQNVDCIETASVIELPRDLSSVGFWQSVCIHLMVKHRIPAVLVRETDVTGHLQIEVASLPDARAVLLCNPLHRPEVAALELMQPAGRPL